MAAVAAALVLVECARQVDREAVSLPVGEAAGERRDLLVAQVLQRLGGESRARAAGAIEDELALAVGDGGLDPRLEIPAWDVDGAGDEALDPLVPLADVDEEGRPVALEERTAFRGVDLVDLGLHLLEQFSIGSHCYPKYSYWRRR